MEGSLTTCTHLILQSMRQITTAAAKQSWLPGSKVPAYLENLPASYGFDPLKVCIVNRE